MVIKLIKSEMLTAVRMGNGIINFNLIGSIKEGVFLRKKGGKTKLYAIGFNPADGKSFERKFEKMFKGQDKISIPLPIGPDTRNDLLKSALDKAQKWIGIKISNPGTANPSVHYYADQTDKIKKEIELGRRRTSIGKTDQQIKDEKKKKKVPTIKDELKEILLKEIHSNSPLTRKGIKSIMSTIDIFLTPGLEPLIENMLFCKLNLGWGIDKLNMEERFNTSKLPANKNQSQKKPQKKASKSDNKKSSVHSTKCELSCKNLIKEKVKGNHIFRTSEPGLITCPLCKEKILKELKATKEMENYLDLFKTEIESKVEASHPCFIFIMDSAGQEVNSKEYLLKDLKKYFGKDIEIEGLKIGPRFIDFQMIRGELRAIFKVTTFIDRLKVGYTVKPALTKKTKTKKQKDTKMKKTTNKKNTERKATSNQTFIDLITKGAAKEKVLAAIIKEKGIEDQDAKKVYRRIIRKHFPDLSPSSTKGKNTVQKAKAKRAAKKAEKKTKVTKKPVAKKSTKKVTPKKAVAKKVTKKAAKNTTKTAK